MRAAVAILPEPFSSSSFLSFRLRSCFSGHGKANGRAGEMPSLNGKAVSRTQACITLIELLIGSISAAPRWPYVVNIFNALACFLLATLYLVNAIPKYNRPVWESVVKFPSNVSVPAIAMVMMDTTSGLAGGAVQFRSEAEGGSEFSAIGVSGDSGELFEGPDTYRVERIEGSELYPAMVASVANISSERTNYQSALQTFLQVTAQTTCELDTILVSSTTDRYYRQLDRRQQYPECDKPVAHPNSAPNPHRRLRPTPDRGGSDVLQHRSALNLTRFRVGGLPHDSITDQRP